MLDALDSVLDGTDTDTDLSVRADLLNFLKSRLLDLRDQVAHCGFILHDQDHTVTAVAGDDLLSADLLVDIGESDDRVCSVCELLTVFRFYIHIRRILERYRHKGVHIHVESKLSSKLFYQILVLVVSDYDVIKISR